MKNFIFSLLILSCFCCSKSEEPICQATTLPRSKHIQTLFLEDRLLVSIYENSEFEICDPEGMQLKTTDCGTFHFYEYVYDGSTLVYTYIPTSEELGECFSDFYLTAKIKNL